MKTIPKTSDTLAINTISEPVHDQSRESTYSRRQVLRTGAALTGTVALGSIAGCLGSAGNPTQVSYPLDRTDPRVQAARSAEKTAYQHYGLEFSEHVIDVEELGGQIRVLEVGSGPPVVMIPGGVGYGVRWAPLVAELAGHTVYVVDRPGGGLSDGVDHQALPLPTIATVSTKAVFDNFDFDGVPIVANSMGGYWSIQFALAHPGRPSALALLGCPALYPGEVTPLPARLMNLPFIGGLLVEQVLQPGSASDVREGMAFQGHPEATARRLPDELVEAAYRMENLPHFTRSWLSLLRSATNLVGVPGIALSPDDLRNVRPRVLLGWGSNDSFGGPEVGKDGAKHFRDAEFHEVGVGHLPWLDEPAAFGGLVREFLAHDG